MRAGNNKEERMPHKHEKKNTILPIIRTYLTALLLITPSVQLKSEEGVKPQQEEAIWIYEDSDSKAESMEVMTSYEIIFKDGIRKALKNLNAIHQIPVWGKTIEYYRDEWTLKGNKIQTESVQILKFPEKFDISPRVITSPVTSMVLHLGNRKFSITPDLGKIKNIYLTSGELVIETTLFFDISYDKQVKLPNMLLKLWMTPAGKWEKSGFLWTTVIEI